METRLASSLDTPALAELHGACFTDGKWNLKQISESLALETTRFWIKSQDDIVMAFIACQIVGDDAEILTFCVRPSARRQGIGKALLDETVTSLERFDVRRIFLEVAHDNEAASKLYTQVGFKAIGKRRGYYRRERQNVDAVIFEYVSVKEKD